MMNLMIIIIALADKPDLASWRILADFLKTKVHCSYKDNSVFMYFLVKSFSKSMHKCDDDNYGQFTKTLIERKSYGLGSHATRSRF